MTNELDILARKYGTDKRTNDDGQTVFHGYTDIYNEMFKNQRMECTSILEIGVREGWSHKMWHDYFPNAMIYGIDNLSDISLDAVQSVENERIKIFIGSQSDKEFLDKSFDNIDFDIIIDDGSHRSWDQQLSFKYLFPKLRHGGCYIIEDLMVHSPDKNSFREFDDIRSSTPVWLLSIGDKKHFSYYINQEEWETMASQVEMAGMLSDELGVILKI